MHKVTQSNIIAKNHKKMTTKTDKIAPSAMCCRSIVIGDKRVEPGHKKTCLQVSNQVRHKLGCTLTEDGLRVDISDSRSRRIVLAVCAADLHLCFCICKKQVFSSRCSGEKSN